MPKMKTRSGAKKRLKLTKSGKVKRAKAFGNHLLSHKGLSRKRNLRKPGFLSDADKGEVKRLLPYG